MLQQEFSIDSALTKMYGLETVIFDDRWPETDLVEQLRRERECGKTSLLAPFEEIDQYIFEKTLEQLYKKDSNDLENIRFLNGAMTPEELLADEDYYNIIKRLVFGNYNSTDLGLLTELLIKAPIIAAEEPEAYHILTGKGEKVSPDPGVKKGEPDKQIHHKLLDLFFQDIKKIGEQVSYGRVQFFGEYLHDLMQLAQDKRYTFMQRMIRREYPFTDENRNEWIGSLHTE